MECPVDKSTLQMTERAGVEIDYCPKCRGVWLDRGELDKIIEKSESHSSAEQPTRESDNRHDANDHSIRDYNDRNKSNKGKKSSFLGDILGNFGGED